MRFIISRLRSPPTVPRRVPSSSSHPLYRPTKSYSTTKESPSTPLPKPHLDYRSIAENVEYKATNALNRKAIPAATIKRIGKLYAKQKELSSTLNTKRHAQSQVGDRIQKAMRDNDDTAKQVALKEAKILKEQVGKLEKELVEIKGWLYGLATFVPNDTHPDVPIGPENAAVTLSTHGPPPLPADSARDHVTVGKALGLFDFEAASQVTGSSWYYLTNEGALLEMALTNYALSIALSHGFSPVITPDVVRTDIATLCGFQPRDLTASQSYHVSTSPPVLPPHSQPSSKNKRPDLVLAGTAEIPLAGFFANKILPPSSLPQKVVGYGRAFRAEAGARGADTRGLYRVHQFTKVELFAVSKAEDSDALMEEMRKIQIQIFEGLGLSFRYSPLQLG